MDVGDTVTYQGSVFDEEDVVELLDEECKVVRINGDLVTVEFFHEGRTQYHEVPYLELVT